MSDFLFVLSLVMLLIGIVLIIIWVATMLLTSQTKSAGLFFTIPGAILVTLGAIGLITPDLFFSWINLVVTALVALMTCVLTIYIYMKNVPPEAPTTTVASSLIGKTGTVVHDIRPDSFTDGKVKIDSTIWSATAKSEMKIGTKVKVIESEGVHVLVETIDETKKETEEEETKKETDDVDKKDVK